MQPIESRAQWPGWKTVRLIGRGSYGTVYEIQRTSFDHVERAALKIISIPHNEEETSFLRSEGYDNATITQRYESYMRKILEEYYYMVER